MPRLQMSYMCRKGVMCQHWSHCRFTYCLAIALSIVPLACNGNGKLSLDGYFVHQQSVIQRLWRWRDPSGNLWTIWAPNSWPLGIAPAHSRVGEGSRLLRRNPIDWLRTACRRNATERRKPLKSKLRSCRAILRKVQTSSLRNCSICLCKV